MSAATGIGETGDADIDIRAIRLAAETTSAGVGADIFVSSNDNLMTTTVGGVTGVSTAGDNDITIFTTGNLTIGDLDPLTGSDPVAAAGAGNVSLSGSDININENISTATGEITLTASDEISTDGTAKVETTSDGFGTLQLDAANDIGSAGIRIRTDVDTFAARLTGATPGDIKVNQIGVTQTELEIGTGSSLSGINTSTGGGNILVQAEAGNIALADVASIINAGAGNVTIGATAGDITVANATAQVEIASTGTVDLTGGAIGATGNEMDLNGATVLVIGDTGAGNIVLHEQGSSTIGSTAITVADATSGSIDIAYNNGDSVSIADGHDLTVDLNQGGSSFSYTATAGDLLVGTVDVTGNHVSLSTIDGSILDNTSLITANSAALDAGGLNKSIGISGTPINVTIANLEAQATGGGIFISSPTQGLTLGGANTDLGGVSTTAGNGEINIDATGTMVVNEAVTADGSGDVSLSATDNLTVNPTFSISSVTGIIELAADSNGIGTGDLNLLAGSSVITGNTTAGAITLRGADLAIDGTADVQATGAGGGIRLFTSLGTRTMNIGGGPAAADFNVEDAELNRLTDFETLTIGERLVQVGTVTLTTVDHATVNDAAIVVNADSGAGGIVLNDDSTGPALNGGIGTIALTAGTGGITAAQANNGFAELSTTGATVTLNTGGTIGTGANRIQLADNTNTAQQNVVIGYVTQPSAVWLDGLGELTLGNISTNTTGANVSVTARGDLNANGTLTTGTGTINLAADRTAADAADDGTGDLNLLAGSSVISANTTASAITLRGANLTIDGTADVQATGVGGGVQLSALVGDIDGGGLITASVVDLSAVTGIGGTTALELAASNISADTTTGTIDIDNTLGTAVTVSSLTIGTGLVGDAGDILFDQSGGGPVTFTTVTTNTTSVIPGQGLIRLTNTGGNLEIGPGGAVTAGGRGTLPTPRPPAAISS